MDNIKNQKRRGRPKKVTIEQTIDDVKEADDDFSSLTNIYYEKKQDVNTNADIVLENVVEYDGDDEENIAERDDQPIVYTSDVSNMVQKIVENKKQGKNAYKKYMKQKTETFDTTNVVSNETPFFSNKGSEILGKDKRELISRLNQYRNLFPNELKDFKVKKNASVEELQEYLDECDSIVSTSSVDMFLTDSILQCIRIVEGVTVRSEKYNISGCADMLKTNPEFHNLTKQMYIKYKVFSKVPPEMQLLMLISTTAWIAKVKNSSVAINSYLDEKI